MRWAGHGKGKGETRNEYNIFDQKTAEKRQLERSRIMKEDNIKMS
jgi:hypothetical protein